MPTRRFALFRLPQSKSLCVSNINDYTNAMNANYTAVLKQDGAWWIGWIEEVPGVNCQEASRDELLDTLAVTLREALELNRSDAIGAAGEGYEEFEITTLIANNS